MTHLEIILLEEYAKEIAKSMKQKGIIISDALKKQLMKSACYECPVCGETVFNQALLGPNLREHIMRKNDGVHLVLEVMNS